MKLHLLFFAAFLSLASCSSDDTTDPVNENPVDKNLKEIAGYSYGEDQISELRKFTDNRMTERYIYNQGEIYLTDLYHYNDQGLLVNREASIGDVTSVNDITYDELGRITAIDETIQLSQNNFTYDNLIADYSEENKIKVNKYRDQGNGTIIHTYIVYDLNNEGYIYKISWYNSENDNSIKKEQLANYQNGNIISVTTTLYTSEGEVESLQTDTYTYDLSLEVKGEYLKVKGNLYGDNKANYILPYENFSFPGNIVSNNFMTESVINNVTTTMEYEFDNSGYPVIQTSYQGNDIYIKYQISYE